MKRAMILTMFVFSECILLDRHWSDAYHHKLKPPPVADGMLKDIRIVNSVVPGKTTFKEVLDSFGNGYIRRLTFEPLYHRKYENTDYHIKRLLDYVWYEKGSPYESGRWIRITMFFDGQEKLAFMYLKDRDYPEKKDYHNIPESLPEKEKRRDWPYVYCDLKYYMQISNPIVGWAENYRYKKWDQCEWEKEFEKEVPR